ncbi:hypothetical protein J6590_038019 [Homalodisca vitripennis]|nr:hypothetical protein J6590_038019 [Homalodisca vitripennis]
MEHVNKCEGLFKRVLSQDLSTAFQKRGIRNEPSLAKAGVKDRHPQPYSPGATLSFRREAVINPR